MFEFGMIKYFLKIDNIVLVAVSQFKKWGIFGRIFGFDRLFKILFF
jgi:hypothetical protein